MTLLYAENEIQKHTSRMKGVKYVQGEDDEKPRLVKIKRPKRAPFGSAGNRFKASPPSYELLPASDNSRNYLGMVDFELNLRPRLLINVVEPTGTGTFGAITDATVTLNPPADGTTGVVSKAVDAATGIAAVR